MEQGMDKRTRIRSKLAGDIRMALTDGEDVIKAAVHASETGVAAPGGTLGKGIGNARTRLAEVARPAIAQVRRTATAANGYVHGRPWTVIGAAAAVGTLIGFLVARR